MSVWSKLFRCRLPFKSLSKEICGGFLNIFATAPAIRGHTYNFHNQDETLEVFIFYMAAVYCAFYHIFDGTLMAALAEMQRQASKNLVEAMPQLNLNRDEAWRFINGRFRHYFESYQQTGVADEEGMASLASALLEKATTLNEDKSRLIIIVGEFVKIHNDVVDFIRNGIPIKILERNRRIADGRE